MGRGSTLALLVVFTVGLHTLLARAQVTAQVAYVASETIYLDRGSGDGLMTGDSALIVRNDSVVARLVVTYLAGRTAACRVVGIGSPQAGDRVAIYPTAPRPVIDGGEDSRPRRDTLKAPQRAVVEPSAAAKGRPVPSHLRMRAGYRFYVQNPSGSGGYEYRQSSLMLNGSLERALGSPWSAYWRLRAGSALRTGRPGRREMRLYEARLSWRDAAKPFKLELGRLIPSRAGGVGWVDGAEIGYRLSGNAVTMGAFAGF
ncbi:MAG: hypothetical protein FJY67_04005, partial [Calditrichaeota bacterium]|nr:hypothetical protein [Calditrichota bacterium]